MVSGSAAGSQKEQVFAMVAGCAAGLESLVEEEIKSFGGEVLATDVGVVRWQGTLETAYRCCLWSRYASRVFLQLWHFSIGDEDSLYNASLSADWGKHLTDETTFAVSCTLSGENQIKHNRFAALRLKDGLVDAFRSKTGKRPSVKPDQPAVQIHLHIDNNYATISLDLSGESLHRRRYRDATGKAPLKETLAAAIVALSGWRDNPQTLIDPMCGSGTLLIEAALMFGDCAPGLYREYFGFKGWLGHSEAMWRSILDEAYRRADEGKKKQWPVIIGYDCDPAAVRAAKKNVELCGFKNFITITRGEIAGLQSSAEKGFLLSNLPYGERLSETELVAQLYRGYGRILRQRFHGWVGGVFIANPELTDSFGLTWEGKHRLYNGSIPCRLLIGTIDGQHQVFSWQPKEQQQNGKENEFANRFRKNLKQMLRWARKEGVSCLRVYDRDLPDYNLSIDLYGKWVHIQEWSPPKNIDTKLAANRFTTAVAAVKEILGVRSDRVFLKTRERQKGRRQYEKKGDSGRMHEVQEGSCSYLVNFTDYLDTGLFLDHRPIRALIFAAARGKRFLNLFGYTGTATIQAAMGGALSTTTVDLSASYLQWARMNLALNGLSETTNEMERADCLEWLAGCSTTYDLIFIDPPTFSNTKKEMRVFDVQEDHVRLIQLAMTRLASDGLVIFSTNFRRFQLAERLLTEFRVTDISRKSIPLDYSRNQKIHKCWEFRHVS